MPRTGYGLGAGAAWTWAGDIAPAGAAWAWGRPVTTAGPDEVTEPAAGIPPPPGIDRPPDDAAGGVAAAGSTAWLDSRAQPAAIAANTPRRMERTRSPRKLDRARPVTSRHGALWQRAGYLPRRG